MKVRNEAIAYVWIFLMGKDVLLTSAQNCKNCIFLFNLRIITQGGNMETRQMTLFFHLFFFLL